MRSYGSTGGGSGALCDDDVLLFCNTAGGRGGGVLNNSQSLPVWRIIDIKIHTPDQYVALGIPDRGTSQSVVLRRDR